MNENEEATATTAAAATTTTALSASHASSSRPIATTPRPSRPNAGTFRKTTAQ